MATAFISLQSQNCLNLKHLLDKTPTFVVLRWHSSLKYKLPPLFGVSTGNKSINCFTILNNTFVYFKCYKCNCSFSKRLSAYNCLLLLFTTFTINEPFIVQLTNCAWTDFFVSIGLSSYLARIQVNCAAMNNYA